MEGPDRSKVDFILLMSAQLIVQDRRIYDVWKSVSVSSNLLRLRII